MKMREIGIWSKIKYLTTILHRFFRHRFKLSSFFFFWHSKTQVDNLLSIRSTILTFKIKEKENCLLRPFYVYERQIKVWQCELTNMALFFMPLFFISWKKINNTAFAQNSIVIYILCSFIDPFFVFRHFDKKIVKNISRNLKFCEFIF